MGFDLDLAQRLTALGVIDERTMIPAGLVDPPADHPWWDEALRRLNAKGPGALTEATWVMVERALSPAHPHWDDLVPYLLERAAWKAKHADWAAQAAAPRPPGRLSHGGGGA